MLGVWGADRPRVRAMEMRVAGDRNRACGMWYSGSWKERNTRMRRQFPLPPAGDWRREEAMIPSMVLVKPLRQTVHRCEFRPTHSKIPPRRTLIKRVPNCSRQHLGTYIHNERHRFKGTVVIKHPSFQRIRTGGWVWRQSGEYVPILSAALIKSTILILPSAIVPPSTPI